MRERRMVRTALARTVQLWEKQEGMPVHRHLHKKLGTVYARMGEWELAESHYADAEESLDAEVHRAELARVLVERGYVAYRLNERSRAMELTSKALQLAEELGDPAAEAQAHNNLGMIAKHHGDLRHARSEFEQAVGLAEASEQVPSIIAVKNNLALVYAEDQPDRAMTLTEEALELSRQQGDRHREAALLSNLADLLHAAGNSADAMTRVEESVAIYADIGIQEGAYQPEIWKLAEW